MRHFTLLVCGFLVGLAGCQTTNKDAPLTLSKTGIQYGHDVTKVIPRGTKDFDDFDKWTAVLDRYQQHEQKQENNFAFKLLKEVNDKVNETRYIKDQRNYKKEDFWATPEEFYKNGGDCEDFAIAKYFLLKEKGFPVDKMRITIAYDEINEAHHGILVVQANDTHYILDNVIKDVIDYKKVGRYKTMYQINEQKWWIHS